MMPQFFACLTSHPLYIPSSFAVETLQLVRNLLRVDWQISPPNSSAIPLIDVDGEKIKPKTKAMKFSAALRDGNARHKKFSSLKVSIKSSTCITDHQISFHVGLYKMQKFRSLLNRRSCCPGSMQARCQCGGFHGVRYVHQRSPLCRLFFLPRLFLFLLGQGSRC